MSVRRGGSGRLRRVAVLLAGSLVACLLPAASRDMVLPGFASLARAELGQPRQQDEKPRALKDFLARPDFHAAVVSPQGRHLAVAARSGLYLLDLGSLKQRAGGVLPYDNAGELHWLDEQRIAVQPQLLVPDLRRQPEPYGSLIVFDITGRTLVELNPVPGSNGKLFASPWLTRSRYGQPPPSEFSLNRVPDQHAMMSSLMSAQRIAEHLVLQNGMGTGPLAFGPVRLVDARRGEGRLLLRTLWTVEDDRAGFGIFELDVEQCRQERLASLPIRAAHVVTGRDGQPALAWGTNHQGEQLVYFLPGEARAEGMEWELASARAAGERGLYPLAWTGREEKYYALDGRGLPTRAVVTWNALDDTREVLYRHPEADMTGVWLDPAGQPWMFAGEAAEPVYWYPDPDHPLASLHRALLQQWPGERFEVLNASDDLRIAVVRMESPTRPPVFIVLEVDTGRYLTGMRVFPALVERRMEPVEPVEFTARDGLVVRGLLTLPLDISGRPRYDAPLLLVAHEGPAGELADRPLAGHRFDFERQLFASRGYAVLQVKVRGSTGLGEAYQRAGDGEWGRRVQDDYLDAARWAMRQGLAPDGRVCMYGSGQGAYSAMMAAARDADVFRCVIALDGIYDLPHFLQSSGEEATSVKTSWQTSLDSACRGMSRQLARELTRSRRVSEEQVAAAVDALNGGAIGERQVPPLMQRAIGGGIAGLWERSPVHNASSIGASVLLLRDARGSNLLAVQMEAMGRALRAAGNPPAMMLAGVEPPQTLRSVFSPPPPDPRVDLYQRILDFLDGQIGDFARLPAR